MAPTRDAVIPLPNGAGWAPCTQAYAAKVAERDALKARYSDLAGDGWVSLEWLDPQDFDTCCRINAELDSMQMAGQIGTGLRTPPPSGSVRIERGALK